MHSTSHNKGIFNIVPFFHSVIPPPPPSYDEDGRDFSNFYFLCVEGNWWVGGPKRQSEDASLSNKFLLTKYSVLPRHLNQKVPLKNEPSFGRNCR